MIGPATTKTSMEDLNGYVQVHSTNGNGGQHGVVGYPRSIGHLDDGQIIQFWFRRKTG